MNFQKIRVGFFRIGSHANWPLFVLTLVGFTSLAATVATGASNPVVDGSENPSISKIQVSVDWPQFMSQQDLVWNRLPQDYYEGAFVGNGLLGTIIFRDNLETNSLRFEIGRTDIYDHRAGGSAMYERCRLPIGQALLTPVGKITSTKLRTDLWNAETRGEITTTAGSIEWRCFVPSDDEVIVLELKTGGGERDAKFSFRAQQGDSPRHTVLKNDKYDYQPNPPFRKMQTNGWEMVVQPLLAGGDYATTWREIKTGDDARTIFLTVANGIPAGSAAKAAVTTVNHAVARGVSALERAHREWWHAFYPASFVSVPDARLESFYWIQWYKLASATRADRPVVDLMGPWFKMSRWAAYWQNLNVQLAYFSALSGNHPELSDRLCRWLEDSLPDLISNCPPEFRADSAVLGNPTGLELKAPVSATHPLHLIALPWLMQQCWLQYRFTMDDERLRARIYPLLRRTFNFYLHVIRPGADGRYHIPNAFSDEYGNAEDTSMNLALLRWGLETLIAGNDRLKLNDPELPKWKEVLAQLADYPVDEATGIMIGKGTPFAKPHRHYSHLFAIFPLYVLNIEDQPELRSLMEKSIHRHVELTGDDCMFKFTGSSSLSAALGDGDTALLRLQRALAIQPKGPTVTPNTLYSEGGWPTFESPISAQRNILDMLLQSWGGCIRVFPACPSAWRDATFHNLRAEGGFLVSAERKNGRTVWVSIRSLAGEPCRIQIYGKIQELKIAKGEEKVIGTDQPIVTPLPTVTTNSWGTR